LTAACKKPLARCCPRGGVPCRKIRSWCRRPSAVSHTNHINYDSTTKGNSAKSTKAKPPRRARCAPGHRTHTAERRDRPVHPRQNPPSLASPTVTHPPHTPKSTQCQTPHASARPPGRSRDGSRLADPHRQANLRRRGDLHRDGDALHHKRHVFASCRRRPTRYAGIELFTETRADSIAGGGG
jgi:hypothetical protein